MPALDPYSKEAEAKNANSTAVLGDKPWKRKLLFWAKVAGYVGPAIVGIVSILAWLWPEGPSTTNVEIKNDTEVLIEEVKELEQELKEESILIKGQVPLTQEESRRATGYKQQDQLKLN